MLSVSTDVSAQLKLASADVERALTAVGTGAANSILTSARDAQATLVTASTDAATQIKSLSADVERTLSAAGTATAASILAGAREVQTTLVTASSDAANHVKSLAPTSNVRCRSPARPPPIRSSPAPARPRHRRRPRHPGYRFVGCGEPGQGAGGRRRTSLSAAGTPPPLDHSPARAKPNHTGHRLRDAANHVKSLAADVQRSLSIAGTSPPSRSRPARAKPRTLVPLGARCRRIFGCRQPRQIAGERRRAHIDDGRRGHRRVHPEQRARGAKFADSATSAERPQPDQGDLRRISSGRSARSPPTPRTISRPAPRMRRTRWWPHRTKSVPRSSRPRRKSNARFSPPAALSARP